MSVLGIFMTLLMLQGVHSFRMHKSRQRASSEIDANASSKPVQVFILMGQSNCIGFGKVEGGYDGTLEYAVKAKKLYPYLVDGSVDETFEWAVRKDVRYVRVMGNGPDAIGRPLVNDWMTIKESKIGPEMGIGHHIGNFVDGPVMILKSCIGNRGLGWDLLPPGSKQFEVVDNKGVTWVHAGYKDSPDRWVKGTEPKRINWYAGLQYDGDVARAKDVLAHLNTNFPGATKYEVAGFLWWQGDKDSRSSVLSDRYEKNLVQLIKALRKDFNAPNAKFVTASLGQTKKGATNEDWRSQPFKGGVKILDAMMAVDGKSGKYPEFQGNVAMVYTHPLSRGGSSGGHYSGNAETYMNVGEAMGKAMVELLGGETPPPAPTPNPQPWTPFPTPAPPPTPAPEAYIVLSKGETCGSKGTSGIDQATCARVCNAKGYKWDGPRRRDFLPGCFVQMAGRWKGNCNYNTNSRASGFDENSAALCLKA